MLMLPLLELVEKERGIAATLKIKRDTVEARAFIEAPEFTGKPPTEALRKAHADLMCADVDRMYLAAQVRADASERLLKHLEPREDGEAAIERAITDFLDLHCQAHFAEAEKTLLILKSMETP